MELYATIFPIRSKIATFRVDVPRSTDIRYLLFLPLFSKALFLYLICDSLISLSKLYLFYSIYSMATVTTYSSDPSEGQGNFNVMDF
jgi:hypothetical protein